MNAYINEYFRFCVDVLFHDNFDFQPIYSQNLRLFSVSLPFFQHLQNFHDGLGSVSCHGHLLGVLGLHIRFSMRKV